MWEIHVQQFGVFTCTPNVHVFTCTFFMYKWHEKCYTELIHRSVLILKLRFYSPTNHKSQYKQSGYWYSQSQEVCLSSHSCYLNSIRNITWTQVWKFTGEQPHIWRFIWVSLIYKTSLSQNSSSSIISRMFCQLMKQKCHKNKSLLSCFAPTFDQISLKWAEDIKLKMGSTEATKFLKCLFILLTKNELKSIS